MKWFILGYFVADIVVYIAMIGKEREVVTAAAASLNALIVVLIIIACVLWL